MIFCSSKPPTHWNLGYQSIFRQENHRIGQPQWSTAPRRGSSTKPRCALQFPAMFLLLARAWLDSLTLPKYRLVWLVGPLFVWIWTIGLLWLAKLPSNCQTLVSPSRKWLHGKKMVKAYEWIDDHHPILVFKERFDHDTHGSPGMNMKKNIWNRQGSSLKVRWTITKSCSRVSAKGFFLMTPLDLSHAQVGPYLTRDVLPT